ncbi:hypothetical protein WME95_30780 [Sorangium sp. So ce327]|uniref:hypothetical protein n=1 Tax=Sorangium sp. So ce327 TaxID=3133301 RepID=UPI003F62AC26
MEPYALVAIGGAVLTFVARAAYALASPLRKRIVEIVYDPSFLAKKQSDPYFNRESIHRGGTIRKDNARSVRA